jgi:hypothetical protein
MLYQKYQPPPIVVRYCENAFTFMEEGYFYKHFNPMWSSSAIFAHEEKKRQNYTPLWVSELRLQ